jgi:hypothetical protein
VAEWLVFARSPRVREAFELIRDFMAEVFRPDALAHVRAVFLVDREGIRSAREAAIRMGLYKTVDVLRGALYRGLWLPGEGVIIVLHTPHINNTYWELYSITAHELGHAITSTPDREAELAGALSTDLPELDTAYNYLNVAMASSQTPEVWQKFLDELLRAAYREVMCEMPADIIERNYFIVLRREVATPDIVASPAAADALGAVGSDIMHAYFERLEEEERARLAEIVDNIITALDAAARKLERGELPHLARKVHEIFAASIKAWPADVMEREPRYRKLLEQTPIG